jgi:hypothetical protein
LIAKLLKLIMLFIFVAFAALAQAMPRAGGGSLLRFGCSQIVIDRIDP